MLVQRNVAQRKHGRTRADAAMPPRSPALLAEQGDGAQLASLRHVRLFAPCPTAVLGSLYGREVKNKRQQQLQKQQQQPPPQPPMRKQGGKAGIPRDSTCCAFITPSIAEEHP
ncbi:hypothetical protein STPYR_12817 [uncultured Stenotrophomonas sp.]|uniref:Uncharacterized protein n=1 Tax=uncultured Stenotrophomonas sp. TaxID=165438 RepID=A0A1Y5QCH0_9GAMM|nr:hypothetical protein STPYR_12817 [uncultured Stenotrophomonas sp.]